jgi:hypothetical protein
MRQIDRVLSGKTGASAMWVIAIGGQLVWLARAFGSIDLADAVALEGIVVAVTFGILAVRVALRHEQELRTVSHGLGGVSVTLTSVSQRLESVSDSVQTQPNGEFPSFLSQITELLAKAEKSITVMCDAPAYGIYSNGPEFDEYAAVLKGRIALRSQNPAFSIDLMFLGDQEREAVQRNATQRYAPTTDEWHAWRESPETQTLLRALVKRVGLICRPEAPPLRTCFKMRVRPGRSWTKPGGAGRRSPCWWHGQGGPWRSGAVSRPVSGRASHFETGSK